MTQELPQQGSHLSDVCQQVFILNNVLHFKSGCTGDRVTLKGVAVDKNTGKRSAGALPRTTAERTSCPSAVCLPRDGGRGRPLLVDSQPRGPFPRSVGPGLPLPAPKRARYPCGPFRTSPRQGSARRRTCRTRLSQQQSNQTPPGRNPWPAAALSAERKGPRLSGLVGFLTAPTTGSATKAQTVSGPSRWNASSSSCANLVTYCWSVSSCFLPRSALQGETCATLLDNRGSNLARRVA
jgi:hypothetical protein